jgi:Fe-S cluster biogenesis protein NfuA
MPQDAALQNKVQRIAGIVERLESSADPNARALVKDLLESLMTLHGAGLERILAFARSQGEPGAELIRKCSSDDLVSSLLILYSLHPDDLKTRVERAIDKTRPLLEKHAARAELISIDDMGTVVLRLHLKPNGGCGSTASSVRGALEAALQDAAPDALAIRIEESGTDAAGFVPLAKLQSAHALSTLPAAPAQRGGD